MKDISKLEEEAELLLEPIFREMNWFGPEEVDEVVTNIMNFYTEAYEQGKKDALEQINK